MEDSGHRCVAGRSRRKVSLRMGVVVCCCLLVGARGGMAPSLRSKSSATNATQRMRPHQEKRHIQGGKHLHGGGAGTGLGRGKGEGGMAGGVNTEEGVKGDVRSSLVTSIDEVQEEEDWDEDEEEGQGLGLLRRITRSLAAGANCVLAGGGSLVPFEKCVGCSQRDAYECIQLMRTNGSHGVPNGCDMYELSLQGKGECCPHFLHPNRPATIEAKTAAYPKAFTCLSSKGCVGSAAWVDLQQECRTHKCNSPFACAEMQSPGWSLRPWPLFTLALTLAATVLLTHP